MSAQCTSGGAITKMVIAHVFFVQIVAPVNMAEARLPRLLKCVEVGHNPGHDDHLLPRHDFAVERGDDRGDGVYIGVLMSAGRNAHIPGSDFGRGFRDVHDGRRVREVEYDGDFDIVSGGRASVPNGDAPAWLFANRPKGNTAGFDGEVSTKLSFGRPFGDSNSPIGVSSVFNRGSPQLVGRAPKGESEYAQREGSEGYKRPLALFGEVPSANVSQARASAEPYDLTAENATTFIKIIILGGVLALLFAVLERFGLADDQRYADRRNNEQGSPATPSPKQLPTSRRRWGIRHRRG